MMILFLSLLVVTQPTAEQLALLRTFREEFVLITPGKGKFPKSFEMGGEDGPANQRPVHQVTFEKPFQVAKYEVPQNLWEAVMGSNPSRWKGPRNSVEMLSRSEAQEFCRKTTSLMRAAKLITEQEEIRLPSESEWEYFARAGTSSRYSFGNDLKQLDEHAWSTRNAAGNDPPVGVKKPNPWGLYDVHGYLWEWCADDAVDDYQDLPRDGQPRIGKDSAARGVLRGGSWKDGADKLTSRYRRLAPRQLRDDAVGLRCVLAPITHK